MSATVRAWIANTDYEWYRFLSGRPDLDEVNFWRPSGGTFRALSAGEPLLFRLKAPHNAIAGVGFFVHFSVLPASLAWAAFEVKNGAASEEAMRARIETYRRRRKQQGETGLDYKVGCIILGEPTFFAEGDWIAQPGDWHPNTEVGRTQDLTAGGGRRVWQAGVGRLGGGRGARAAPTQRFCAPGRLRPRLRPGGVPVPLTPTH